MLLNEIKMISSSLFENFENLRVESIVFTVGEIIRGLIQIKEFYIQMLDYEFFTNLYRICACDKFIVSNEMFHVLFFMIESEKVSKEVFKEFFLENNLLIMENLINTLNYFMSIEETYLVERDTLVVSYIILISLVLQKINNEV